MTRLIWNDFGSNEFQSGVDRVVLYVDGHTGVPWNGVTNVKLNPIGGEPRPCYLDGVKVFNPHSPEEAAGSIEAYFSPEEFDLCDGTISVLPGLTIGQQTRTPFCLSYRTLVGNDLDGSNAYYRIHFLFNLMASASSKARTTNSQSIEVNTLSWDFVSRPVLVPGYYPSAYMFIDTKDFDPEELSLLEDLIYGTDIYPPLCPTPEGLIYLEAARFDDGKYDLDTYA